MTLFHLFVLKAILVAKTAGYGKKYFWREMDWELPVLCRLNGNIVVKQKIPFFLFSRPVDDGSSTFTELWNPLKTRLGKKNIFLWTLTFGITDLAEKARKLRQISNCNKTAEIKYLTQMHFFFLLTGASLYYYDIYILFTYFASFTGYEDGVLEVISSLHIKESKYGRKIYKFCGKSF